jgi:wyosine [tRNA(Phe)-imidazoG37] synthetase (radical SAM superfamily)
MNAALPASAANSAFGCPRDFLDNRFVYIVISPRAGGLSLGVNMNPDRFCNFDCVYCEVNRREPARESRLDVRVMLPELERMLALIHSGGLRTRPRYLSVPPELLQLRHIALSGDGEPTLCPNFVEAVEALVSLRARGNFPFFKLVLVTNGSGLDGPQVAEGLQLFSEHDEVWAKLEAGTQEYMDRVNRADLPLEKILANILALSRRRPVVVQSLFPSLEDTAPSDREIEAYVQRLRRIRDAGANIPLIQIYSATRPTVRSKCGHLPLRTLAALARRVQAGTGLKTEVF